MARGPSRESATTVCKVNYQLLAVMLQKKPYVQLPVPVDYSQLMTMASEMVDEIDWAVAVDHSQLRIMASETVDPIDWSLPPSFTDHKCS